MSAKIKDVIWVARTKRGEHIKFRSEAHVQKSRPRGSHYGVIVLKTGNFIPVGPRWNVDGKRNLRDSQRKFQRSLAESVLV
jgi:hypothetical protein